MITIDEKSKTATATFDFTGDIEIVPERLEQAAHYLWDHGYGDHGTEELPIQFGSLKSEDHIAILKAYFIKTVNEMANGYCASSYWKAAQEAAEFYYKERQL
jgi:hypothetical protein